MLGGLLSTYLFAMKATREEMRTVDERMEAIREGRRRAAKSAGDRTRALEDDLARVALLARSLAELCLEKGLLTEAELGRKIVEVDLADGVGDGRLDPAVALPGEQKLAKLEPLPERPIVRRKPRKR